MNASHTHPIWHIFKALVVLAFATLFAYTNAENFDETEVKMLLEIGGVLFGGATLEALIHRQLEHRPQPIPVDRNIDGRP